MICVETGAGLKPEPLANFFFNFRIEKRERADRATDLPNRHRFARALQAFAIAAHLVVPKRETSIRKKLAPRECRACVRFAACL